MSISSSDAQDVFIFNLERYFQIEPTYRNASSEDNIEVARLYSKRSASNTTDHQLHLHEILYAKASLKTPSNEESRKGGKKESVTVHPSL